MDRVGCGMLLPQKVLEKKKSCTFLKLWAGDCWVHKQGDSSCVRVYIWNINYKGLGGGLMDLNFIQKKNLPAEFSVVCLCCSLPFIFSLFPTKLSYLCFKWITALRWGAFIVEEGQARHIILFLPTISIAPKQFPHSPAALVGQIYFQTPEVVADSVPSKLS